MSGAFAGLAYLWLAQAIAFVLMPLSIPLGVRLRALVFWAIAAALVLLVQPPLSMLLALALLLLIAPPWAPLDRAAFYLIAVPAVPVFVAAPLPFPGINYLTELSHLKFASLILLLPVLLARARSETSVPDPAKAVFVVLLIFVAYKTVLYSSSYDFIGGLRYLLDQTLTLIIPFFAIVLALRRPKDIDKLFQAFLIVALLLASVAIVSKLKNWDIYGTAAFVISEMRDGELRINATAGTHSLAFHLAAAIVILEYLKHRLPIGWLQLNAMRIVLVGGMITADSRGAYGALIVALCVYVLLIVRNGPLRTLLQVSACVAFLGGTTWLIMGDTGGFDQYGTFSYRQQLLWTSVEYIGRYPLFGDRHFLQSDHFDHLLQGQGIVDITNLYLQVALSYGLIGLALFAGVFVIPYLTTALMLLRMRRREPRLGLLPPAPNASEDDAWYRATAVAVANGAGWLFLISTTSNVGLTTHLGVILVALCYALRRMRPFKQPSSVAAGAPNGLAPVASA